MTTPNDITRCQREYHNSNKLYLKPNPRFFLFTPKIIKLKAIQPLQLSNVRNNQTPKLKHLHDNSNTP